MQKSKENNLFLSDNSKVLNFKPAYLSVGKQILVIYYYKNFNKNKLQRFRISVPKKGTKKDIIKLGHKMVEDINQKLFAGWNPFNKNSLSYDSSFDNAKTRYIEQGEKDILIGIKREDTVRSYKSFIRMLDFYLNKQKIKIDTVSQIDRIFIIHFLDFMLYERGVSPRTYNNYISSFITFLNFCIDKGYTKHNPALTIKKLQNQKKRRKVLTDEIKNKVKLIQYDNSSFYTLCMMTYYCFIRRTELTKLKVKDVNLPLYITMRAEISKNKKENNVTVPKQLNELLSRHIYNASAEDYLFSENFMPGRKKLAPKKISDEWNVFRKKYDVPKQYQFYSLKDTGITDLLNKGIPAIKVRDQARHYDLRITESYTQRNDTFDPIIKDIDFTF